MQTRTLYIPTLEDVEEARKRISRYLQKTPLRYSTSLSKLTGVEVYIKYENHNPTCAFKVRGGINILSKLISSHSDALIHPIIVVSTGNHGQSIAYAGKLFKLEVIVVCPENSNQTKVQAMKDLGAKIIFHGKDFDEAREYCEKLAQKENYFYIHSANEPDLIAGVGTIGLEVLEDLPDLDCFITAVGAGSGVCGSSIALKEAELQAKSQGGKKSNFTPHSSQLSACSSLIKVYGVQSTNAPAVHDSFRQKKIISYPSLSTFAEGLATRETFELPFKIMQKYVDDIFLVTDEELKKAILLLLECEHTIAEGAGASSVAALIKNKAQFQNKKVVCVLTGGNLQLAFLKEIIAENSHNSLH